MKEKEKNTTNVSTNKKEILHKIVAHLKGKQIITTQKDLAKLIKFNEKNFSSAFNGNERYLTDSLLNKIYNKFPDILKTIEETDGYTIVNDSSEIKTLPVAEQMEMLLSKILQLEDSQKKISDDLRISQIINRGLLKVIARHLKIKPEEIEKERLNEEQNDKNKTAIN